MDEVQRRIGAIEQRLVAMDANMRRAGRAAMADSPRRRRRLTQTHADVRRIQRTLEAASEDAAHIEFLSHQYAFVTFLPSIAGVLVAIAVLSLETLDPVPFLMVVAAGILSLLSPLMMLVIGRQYRRDAGDRFQLLEQRRRRVSRNAADR